MKKTYMMPATCIVKIAPIKMIAASLDNLTDIGGKATLTDEYADQGSVGMSRGGSLWDED